MNSTRRVLWLSLCSLLQQAWEKVVKKGGNVGKGSFLNAFFVLIGFYFHWINSRLKIILWHLKLRLQLS